MVQFIDCRVVTKRVWNGPVHLISVSTARQWYQAAATQRLAEKKRNHALVSAMYYRHRREIAQRSLKNVVVNNVSFATVAAKQAVSDPTAKSIVPAPKETRKPIFSRYECRRDYTLTQKEVQKERASFKALAESIAARYTRVKWIERESYSLYEKRPWVKTPKPKQVESFPIGCYRPSYEEVSQEIKVVPTQQIFRPMLSAVKRMESRGVDYQKPLCVSPKQVKIRQVRVDNSLPYEGERVQPKGPFKKIDLMCNLIQQLSKTSNGKQLFICYAIRWMQIKKSEKILNALREYGSASGDFSPQWVEAQMDDEPAVNPVDVQVTPGGSMALATQKMSDSSIPPRGYKGLEPESTSFQSQQFSTLSDRWILFDNLKWGLVPPHTAHNTCLKKYSLPYDILSQNKDSPNVQLFMIHKYWRGDIDIKIVLNSNQFQVGQLMCSFLYNSDLDDSDKGKMASYRNLYSCSQRPHCLINAGSSNDGELHIPYFHPHAMLECMNKNEKIGELIISVVNQLSYGEAVAPSCSISLSAKFSNVSFHCNISRSLAVNNMFKQITKLAGTATKVLNTIDEDWNRDNPPLPILPLTMTPQSMSSFAYTDGIVEPVNVLRADSRGQTPSQFVSNDMTLDYVQVPGLLTQFAWGTGHLNDAKLISLEVTPLMKFSNYPNTGTNVISRCMLPPIAVISSMFGYWRGSIKYRFDIVASKFHTGTLMVTFVPFREESNYSINVLKFSHSIIVDTSSSSSFEFETPWYNINPCIPVYRPGGGEYRIGRVYVKVVNPLIAVDQVAKNLQINVYISAGKSFELMIPRMATLAPTFSSILIPPKGQYIVYYDKTAAWFTTWESNLIDDAGQSYVVPYISSNTNGWVGFLGVSRGDCYRLLPESTGEYFQCVYYIKTTKNKKEETLTMPIEFGVYDPELSTANAHGLVIVASRNNAIKYARGVRDGKDLKSLRKQYGIRWVQNGPWSQFRNSDGIWRDATSSDKLPLWEKIDITEDSNDVTFEIIENNMDSEAVTTVKSVPIIVSDVKPTPSTSGGMQLFGERTQDLKSLCRRWIHYCSIAGKSCNSSHPRDCVYTFRMGLQPYRRLSIQHSEDYDNRAREGTISLVGSGYYLYKGGMRLRFIVMGNPPEGSNLYLQHRYDETYSETSPIVEYGTSVKSVYDMLSTQYASFVQNLNVNPTVSIEVPYYQSNEALLAVPIRHSSYYSLGSLYGWVHTPTSTEFKIEVYYSLADDSRFAIRQGFPSMFSLDEILPQSDDTPKETPSTSSKPDDKAAEKVSTGKAILNTLKAAFTPTVVSETATAVQDASTSVVAVAEEVREAIKEHVPWYKKTSKFIKDQISSMKKGMLDLKEKLFSQTRESIMDFAKSKLTLPFQILSAILMMVISPVPGIIGLAIVNIYVAIWGFSLDGFTSLASKISGMWSYLKAKWSKKQPQTSSTPNEEQPTNAENNMGSEEVASVASVLYTGISAFCKVKTDKSRSATHIEYIAKGMSSVANSMRESSYLATFLKGNLEMLKRAWSRVVSLFKVDKKNHDLIKLTESDILKNWIIDSTAILSPQVRDEVYSDQSYAYKVFELALLGRSLYMCLLSGTIVGVPILITSVSRILAQLTDLEKSLIDRKCYSGVRYEPFCLWLCGSPGVGKTHVLNELGERFAFAAGSKCVPSFHSMTAGNVYFDEYRNQPTICIDDFLATTMTANSDIYLQFLQMKSKSLFNPPYAKVDEKDKLINFQNLIITSNMNFVSNIAGINFDEAFNRRRDLLVELKFKDPSVTKFTVGSFYKPEQIAAGEHFEAFYYPSPDIVNSEKLPIPQLPGRNNYENFIEFILLKASEYHAIEAKEYARRSRAVMERLNMLSATSTSVADYIHSVRKEVMDVNENICTKKSDMIPVLHSSLQRSRDAASFAIGKFTLERMKNGKEALDLRLERERVQEQARKEEKAAIKRSIEQREQLKLASVSASTVKDALNEATRNKRKAQEREKILQDYLNMQQSHQNVDRDPDIEPQIDDVPDNAKYLKLDELLSRVPATLYHPAKTPITAWPINTDNNFYFAPIEYVTHLPETDSFLVDPCRKRELDKSVTCCHRAFDFSNFTYDSETQLYVSNNSIGIDNPRVTYAVSEDVCLIYDCTKKALVYSPVCEVAREETARIFYMRIIKQLFKNKAFVSMYNLDPMATALEAHVSPKVLQTIREDPSYNATRRPPAPPVNMPKALAKEVESVKNSVTKVGDVVVPKNQGCDCTWWTRFLKFLKYVGWIIMEVVILVGAIIVCILSMFGIYKYMQRTDPKTSEEFRDFYAPVPNQYNFYGTDIREEEKLENQIHPSGDYTQIKAVRPTQKALELVKATHQDGDMERVTKLENDSQISAVKNKILNNTIWFIGECEDETGTSLYRARGLGLYGRTVLFLKHYYELFKAKNCKTIILKSFKDKIVMTCKLSDFEFAWNSEGVGTCELTHSFPYAFANIVKYMPSDSSRFVAPYECILVEPFSDSILQTKVQIKDIQIPVRVAETSTQSGWTITQGYYYDYGGKGVCGSFLFCPSLATPLIGIHTAGVSDKKGFSQKLFRETYKPKPDTVEYVRPEMDYKPYTYTLEGEYEIVGTLDRDMSLYSPTASRIKPSLIHGVFPISSEPAPLSDKDPRILGFDPLKLGVSKRCDKTLEFNREDLNYAYEHLTAKLLEVVKPLKTVSKLSICQAIEGFSLPGYEKMALRTSEGYPWVKMRPIGESDKSWMFKLSHYEDNSFKVESIYPPLLDTLKFKEQMRRSGVVPASYFSASLKDARISLEKVTIPGKTRVFEISPVDLTIAQRQNFLDFIAAYQTARLDAENTIGINCDGREWNDLVDRLLQNSPYIITADYSSFGPRLNSTVLFKTFEIAIEWYKRHQTICEDPDVLEKICIAHEVTHGLHVVKNLVFRPTAGLPSGNAETVEKNSLSNSLYIRLAYLGLSRKYAPQYNTLDFFDKYVVMFHNGDDLIMSVHPTIIKWFNNTTLIEFFSWYNIKMTDALKSGKIRDYCSIEEATYLKRGFAPHPYRRDCWLAPLEKSSIKDTANWIWKCPNELDASVVNSEQACRLAYSHGPQFYQEIAQAIKRKWKELNFVFNYPSWRSLDSAVWDGVEGPTFQHF